MEKYKIDGLGELVTWQTGEKGGTTETHHAKLVSKKRPSEDELKEIEKAYNIRSGSPFDSGRVPPRTSETENKEFETKWYYNPSTN